MRQGRTLLHRFTIILLILGMLVQLTGCGDLLDGFAIGDIETFVNETFSSFMANPSKTNLNQYSKKKYDFSVSDEQLDVFYYSLRNADFQIKDTSVGSSRESGKCTVEFKNVPDITKLDQTVGTFDDLKKGIDKLDRITVKIKFKVVKDDGQWMFKDISDFWDEFLPMYEEICVLEKDGSPADITPEYVESFLVDCVWYDPVYANPLEKNSVEAPSALLNVLYFNKPMKLVMSYKLFLNGDKIYSGDIEVNNRVTSEVDLDSQIVTGNSKYQSGEYKIEYYIGDTMIMESPVIIVK